MRTAVYFSYKNKILKKTEYQLILKHINNSILLSSINKFFKSKDTSKILSYMEKDKKNNSAKINLVLLKKIGTPIYNKLYTKKNINSFLKNYLND